MPCFTRVLIAMCVKLNEERKEERKKKIKKKNRKKEKERRKKERRIEEKAEKEEKERKRKNIFSSSLTKMALFLLRIKFFIAVVKFFSLTYGSLYSFFQRLKMLFSFFSHLKSQQNCLKKQSEKNGLGSTTICFFSHTHTLDEKKKKQSTSFFAKLTSFSGIVKHFRFFSSDLSLRKSG